MAQKRVSFQVIEVTKDLNKYVGRNGRVFECSWDNAIEIVEEIVGCKIYTDQCDCECPDEIQIEGEPYCTDPGDYYQPPAWECTLECPLCGEVQHP